MVALPLLSCSIAAGMFQSIAVANTMLVETDTKTTYKMVGHSTDEHSTQPVPNATASTTTREYSCQVCQNCSNFSKRTWHRCCRSLCSDGMTVAIAQWLLCLVSFALALISLCWGFAHHAVPDIFWFSALVVLMICIPAKGVLLWWDRYLSTQQTRINLVKGTSDMSW